MQISYNWLLNVELIKKALYLNIMLKLLASKKKRQVQMSSIMPLKHIKY